MIFRRGEAGDAVGYARTKVLSWRQAYAPFLPAEFLANLSEQKVAEDWPELITRKQAWVAVDDSAGVVGYSMLGIGRFEGLEDIPEVQALYVQPEFQGRGIGRSLMARSLRDAVRGGHAKAMVCAFALNERARGVYEAWGAPTTAHGIYRLEGVDYDDVAHVFSDPAGAVARLMPIRVRPYAEGDDLEHLTAMLHDSYGELAEKGMHFLATHQSAEVTRERLTSDHGFIVEAEGRTVGTVSMYLQDELPYGDWAPEGAVASFGQFAVDREYQGFGIGTRVIGFLEDFARAKGMDWLALDTAVPAEHLHRYYEGLGFAVVGSADYRPVVNYPSVVMAKRLGGV